MATKAAKPPVPFSDQPTWWKPKLYAAGLVFLVATVALFTKFLSGGEWVTASTLMLGVFTAGSVAENKAIMDSQ